jgi:hypothetical protein
MHRAFHIRKHKGKQDATWIRRIVVTKEDATMIRPMGSLIIAGLHGGGGNFSNLR